MRLNLSLGAALLLAMLAGLLAGQVWISPQAAAAGDTAALILYQLRLPRLLLGALIGAGLGLSGAVMQGYLRNPLAEPGLFGVSACAALGAVLAIFVGVGVGDWRLSASALTGAAAAMALLALLAGRTGSLLVFALAGVVQTSLAGALTALVISLAPTPFAVSEIVTWSMGALTDRSWNDLALAAPPALLGMAILATTARDLEALTLGETVARSLGVDLGRLRWRLVAGIGLTVGAGVAVAGIIGFVGLIVPHLVRPFAGHRPAALLLPSALAGALLVVVADAVVRVLPLASELRLGVAMSLLGAPFFLLLLLRLRRQAL